MMKLLTRHEIKGVKFTISSLQEITSRFKTYFQHFNWGIYIYIYDKEESTTHEHSIVKTNKYYNILLRY